jgi:hypothetical protein
MSASNHELRSIIGRLLSLLDASHGGYAPLTDEGRDLLERAKLAAAATDDGPRVPLDADGNDLFAYLTNKAAGYGIPGMSFTLYTGSPPLPGLRVLAQTADVTGWGSGDTIDEAVAELRKLIVTPEQKAAKLRAEAQKLLGEAMKLEGVEPVLP